MLRRLVLTAAASVAALTALAPAASGASGAPAGPLAAGSGASPLASPLERLAPLPLPLLEERPDSFTVTVAGSGVTRADGSFKLECGPVGGTHPRAKAACDRLTELAGSDQDPFAPVAKDQMCTMQYGGDATARVTGIWRGRNVDATFNRKNGCEIARWKTMEPILPAPAGS
ncbi:subtilase-type protease inhibitor [Streptomyces sp. NBC_01317]|uniref:SSI family serine proteinase inhibitor n=1 Tax=Streptomyces sp. NBC_01317 TaxID=2903822 RepID=UPI002E0D6210|nr:subtilase-type protease inhibitor [Streptomyces sp. NBC_01317]